MVTLHGNSITLGIYFGKPRGFSTNENGEEIGFNTEVYAAHEVVTQLLNMNRH